MRIDRLQLKNFCQHRDLDVKFSPTMNLIRGRNGAGKTNLLRAATFILTGDGGGERNKVTDVSLGTAARESALVRGWLTHGGNEYVVERHLRSGTASLTMDGQTIATGALAVNTVLLERLGRRVRVNRVFAISKGDSVPYR